MIPLSNNHILKKFKDTHGDLYDYSLVEYINAKTKVKIICPIHGVFEQIPINHINGSICHKCSGNYMDTEYFIEGGIKIHGDLYDYSLVEYINTKTKVKIICPIHGVFEQNANSHLKGHGCAKCAKQYMDTEYFIEKASEKYNGKYGYSLTKYITPQINLKIICPIHGVFEQNPNKHLSGHGCPKCKKIKDLKEKRGDKLIMFNKVHGGKYCYSKVVYKGIKTKVKIICPIHGLFEQTPIDHIHGKGCPICGYNKISTKLIKNIKMFINDAISTHGDKYDYSKVNYIGSKIKVIITCPTHGDFMQTPDGHLQGKNCPKCSHSGPSKSEEEILEYIKSISITAETSNRTVLNGLELDIYIPSHNIAIEFDGLYWHSEVHKDKKYHLNKTELCLKKGIQLIHIFEDEWILKKDIVKSRLKNILGLTSNKIFGRKTVIKEVETKQARLFFENNHLQGYTNSKIKLGLYHEDELVSCMLFSKPRIGIGSSYDGYELTRFANLVNTNVIGGASKLLKYFEKVYQPVEIRSYADRRWSDGGLYKTLGFELSHINKPNYWYIEGNQRKHRFGFRKELLKKLGFDTKNQTEHEIMLERKIYRIYDCGTLSYKKYSSKYHYY